ncbi:MAG: hypothetical protein AAF614_19030 [Chloroflexota bacterium]
MSRTKGFTQGIGRWIGAAEVYDGNGRFVGNATDQRHVQREAGANRVRIDLSFIGPMKFAGHYIIEDHIDYRLYQGPANTGYAETLAENLIDANAYWPITGLTQRFFLMVLPDGNRQMSLALMSRGEKLIYVVVGEYNRVDESHRGLPDLVNGIAYDLADDPAAGRSEILLHRPGTWRGELATLDRDLVRQEATQYVEMVEADKDNLQVAIAGAAFAPDLQTMRLKTNGWEAWSKAGDLVGSYSMSGGRALSGNFHYLQQGRRVWRREVVSHDGTLKAVVHVWYRGAERVGVQFGVLGFEE